MKKVLHIGIYWLYPVLLAAAYAFLNDNMYDTGAGAIPYTSNIFIRFGVLTACYGLPFFGLYYFSKVRPFNQWLLWIGFALVPVYYLVYEYIRPTIYQYLGTIIYTLVYALPFIIISLIFAAIISNKDKRIK